MDTENVDQNIDQYDQDRIYCTDKCCINVSTTMLTAFLYIAFMIVPFVSEIIAAVYHTPAQRTMMVVVCGSLQIILAVCGGFMMGKQWFLDDKNTWCKNDFTDFRSMITPEYILFITPQWLITNVIVWGINGGSSQSLGSALVVFLPVPMYILSLFAGYAYVYAIQKEITSIV